MAYVPGYKYDLFISFAHVDNKSRGGAPWVAQFHEDLFDTVASCLGSSKELTLWRDENRLAGNTPITDAIQRALTQTAAFVCIVSKGFVESDWCPRELEHFCAHQDQLKVAGFHRVFKVMRRGAKPLGRKYLDEELLGFPFYDEKPPKDFTADYWPTPGDQRDQRYWIAMEKLGVAVAELLVRMAESVRKIEEEAGSSSPTLTPGTSQPDKSEAIATVYLADVTDDLYRDRRQLEQALWQKRIRVLPERSLPMKRAELEQIVRQWLSESQLAIHMFGHTYGRPLRDDETRSLAHIQYELAKEIATKDKKLERIIWLAPNPHGDELEECQLKLLEVARGETGGSADFDFQEGDISLNRLKRAILQRIEQPVEPPPDAKKCTIYLTGTKTDLNAPVTQEMINWFEGRHRILPSDEEDLDSRKLKYCDGLMIIYGLEQSKDLAEIQTLQALNLTDGRKRNPLAIAVFDAPPEQKADFGLTDTLVLDSRHGFEPGQLQPFLKQLENRP